LWKVIPLGIVIAVGKNCVGIVAKATKIVTIAVLAITQLDNGCETIGAAIKAITTMR
jgi:hypothetical protein